MTSAIEAACGVQGRQPVWPGRSGGLALTALLVSLLISTTVLAGVVAIYVTVIRGSSIIAQEDRLNQELRAAMDMLVNDIRRAGYWSEARPHGRPGGDVIFNPFMNRDPKARAPEQRGVRDIFIHPGGTAAGSDCIMLSYDTPVATPHEVFGYRVHAGAVEMFHGGSDTQTRDCTGEGGLWQRISSDEVVVEGLHFSFTIPPSGTFLEAPDAVPVAHRSSQCLNTRTLAVFPDTLAGTWPASWEPPCENTPLHFANPGDVLIESRMIRITLHGAHAREPQSRAVFTDAVAVRNDRILIARGGHRL